MQKVFGLEKCVTYWTTEGRLLQAAEEKCVPFDRCIDVCG